MGEQPQPINGLRCEHPAVNAIPLGGARGTSSTTLPKGAA
jgi:hypothetical protein